MAFIKREKGGFSVRQGSSPFPVLDRFQSRADAEKKKRQVEAENKPKASSVGALAARAFTSARKDDDIEAIEGVGVVRQPRKLVAQKPQKRKPRGSAALMARR